MLTVKELARLAASLKPAGLKKQLGPFALVQRPPEAEHAPVALDETTNPWGEPEATTVARAGAVNDGTLAMLFQFEALEVTTLPPLAGNDELSVGRQADCDLVINHASVSKRHATLRWNDAKLTATVQDLGSTNGTFINAGRKLDQETTLNDGDIVSFGEVQFWYLRTETLHQKLSPGDSKVPRGI
jgi:pSer/pThr/pTyr-binding forkhead associated (FHA) protein